MVTLRIKLTSSNMLRCRNMEIRIQSVELWRQVLDTCTAMAVDEPTRKLLEPRAMTPESSDSSIRVPEGTCAAITAHRLKTLQILEGKLRTKPDREYPANLAVAFRFFEWREKQAHVRQMIHAVLGQPRRFGWAFLRQIILSALDMSSIERFPALHPLQRAFLLEVDDADDMVPHRTRDLEACSREEMRSIVRRIQERGWRDVILVTEEDGRVVPSPDCVVPWKRPDVVHWGSA